MFGKRIVLEELEYSARGICTAFCPSSCKSVGVTWCKCRNNKYENRGSTYGTMYAKAHMNFVAPDWD